MHPAISRPGVAVVDARLNIVSTNTDAIDILTFPDLPNKNPGLNSWLADRLRSCLLDRRVPNLDVPEVRNELRSGRRLYKCDTFCLHLDLGGTTEDIRPAYVIVLERHNSGFTALSQIAYRFALTAREMRVVQLLMQGLTSKQIADRMNISPNTIKGFLRLIMAKMKVSTRTGIVGSILEPTARLQLQRISACVDEHPFEIGRLRKTA